MTQKNKASSIFLMAAVICFAVSGYFIYERYVPVTVSFSQLPNSSIHSSENDPVEITIPSAKISLPISTFENKTPWPLSKKSVVHLQNTPVYYAHNWPNLFGSLHNVLLGDTIEIRVANGGQKTYTVDSVVSVWPTDSSVLNVSVGQIAVYTCTGFLDSKRLVLVATPIN